MNTNKLEKKYGGLWRVVRILKGRGYLDFFYGLINSIFSNFYHSSRTLIFFVLLLSFHHSTYADTIKSYRFSADDQISIDVLGEPELSRAKVRIAMDGTISLPFIGQIKIQGLTSVNIEEKLTRLFTDGYLKKPVITVSIIEYRQFYISGEVKKPGGYSYRDGLTVERAVALAGGFSVRASMEKIKIEHEQSTNSSMKVTLKNPVRPGDIITIGESFF